MSRLYLDTEFNSFGGKLISMALVSPTGREWYECMPCPDLYDTWVSENVIPVLGKTMISRAEFLKSFRKFIEWFDRPEVVCDWHTDVMHFCACLDGDDFKESAPFDGRFRVIQTPEGEPKPEIPHNALSDAKALMRWHMGFAA